MRSRNITLSAICAVAFALALVALAPAGAVKLVLAQSERPIALIAPRGRLWAGNGELQFDGGSLGQLSWRLQPTAFLNGRIGAALTLDHRGHHVEGRAAIGIDTVSIEDLQATVREGTIDRVLRPYAIDGAGEFRIRDAALTRRGSEFLRIIGHGRWSGGRVRYRLGGTRYAQVMPPMLAQLSQREGLPVLLVTDEAERALFDVALDSEGWATVRVRYRFIVLTGFPWPSRPAPDKIILELEEQVF